MKRRWIVLFIMMMSGLAQSFQINNYSDDTFIGNNYLDLELKKGQVAEIEGYLVNGQVYGYLDVENMNSNECYFQAGTDAFDWNSVIIPIQYSFNFGCTVATPRLCCMEMPDEF